MASPHELAIVFAKTGFVVAPKEEDGNADAFTEI
jgi:hypothetical protein